MRPGEHAGEGVTPNLRQGFHAVGVWGRGGGRFLALAHSCRKQPWLCFLMTLQDAGFKFSRRVETDGRASWCKRGEENMRAKKKRTTWPCVLETQTEGTRKLEDQEGEERDNWR